jgi:15-cis-phytoene synthase
MIAIEDAYTRCEAITRAEARNFSYGIRLLPDDKRRAMSALYAFARRVDDIGDGAAPIAQKLDELQAVREDVALVEKGDVPADDPVLVALSDTAHRYPIDPDALLEIVEGCEMDCRQQHYASFEELTVYCRCVAGSVGRLSLQIFGSDAPEAPVLADTLGIALQVTNILRDIVEDREVMGRVYLPADDLARFACAADASGPVDNLVDCIRFEASRASERYREGLALLDLLDRRSRACVAAMAGIYRRLLVRIERDPSAVLSGRISLPAWEKAYVAARSLAGVTP